LVDEGIVVGIESPDPEMMELGALKIDVNPLAVTRSRPYLNIPKSFEIKIRFQESPCFGSKDHNELSSTIAAGTARIKKKPNGRFGSLLDKVRMIP